MTFLPIVARELRVAARRRGTYWTRLGAALTALGIGAWVMLLPDYRSPQRLGMALFGALAVISYLFSLLAGMLTTADCLSEEKREGTLGLLFLTDLKGYDIVLGKLAATSLNCLYGLLAIFPVMAIPLLAGGVTGTEFWRVVLVSVNNLLFSLSLGMFSSAVSKDERKAILLTFVLLLFFTAGTPMIGSAVAHWNEPGPAFYVGSPAYECFMAFDSNFRSLKGKSINLFYVSALSVHGLTWIFLIASAVIVPRVWQDRAENARTAQFREWWLRVCHGSAATRAALRKRLLELNPFCWLSGRDRMKALLVWGFLAGGAIIWSWGLWRYPLVWKDTGAYVFTALTAHTVVKIWLATEACRRFAADRKSGALELLLSTPLKVEEILRGQLLALFKQFAAPAAVLLLVDFIFMMTERNETDWVLVWISGMIIFIADLFTLSWVGMWTGLSSRHANRATGAALARVLVLPWMIYGLVLTFVALVPNAMRASTTGISEGHFLVVSWTVIGLVIDAFFGFSARNNLLSRFRNIVTQRFEGARVRRSRLPAGSAPVLGRSN